MSVRQRQKVGQVVRRKDVRKDAFLRIRLTAAEKTELTAAATHDGLGLSTWLLVIGLQTARARGDDRAPILAARKRRP